MSDDDEQYFPVRVLNRGTFGKAVLCRRAQDDTLIVWKEIDLSRADANQLRRARQETDIIALLRHPNVIDVYNDYVDGNRLLIETEFCEGDHLGQRICAQREPFDEEHVRWMFFQLASAVKYIHDHGTIHRDIRPSNVFFTKNDVCKLGDLGLERIMHDGKDMTLLDVESSCYMAPEVHLGRPYGEKADVWSCGCLLYEMCALDAPFKATNPAEVSVLVVESEVAEISQTQYSDDLRSLLKQLLLKEPNQRPDSIQLLASSFLQTAGVVMEQKLARSSSSSSSSSSTPPRRSSSVLSSVIADLTSEVYCWGGEWKEPHKVDVFSEDRAPCRVSAGHCHFAVVTVNKQLYTWACGQIDVVGQLGHGDRESYDSPKRVDALLDVTLQHSVCGRDFTMSLSDDGRLFSCGSDGWGCLGDGDDVVATQEETTTVETFVLSPLRVAFFGDLRRVNSVACGDAHVVVLTDSKEVYSWGCGKHGRLGLGSQDNVSTPTKVPVPGRSSVVLVSCGARGTMLLTGNGRVLACGDNELNQLGLNVSFNVKTSNQYRKTQLVSFKWSLSPVKALNRYHIMSVACGSDHSAVINDAGCLILFGSNEYGQLGVGDFRRRQSPVLVKGKLLRKRIAKVACGDGFTVASAADNVLYSWGRNDANQLGLSSQVTSSSSVSLPVPITSPFRSVRVVDLACRHWHTIIIAGSGENEMTTSEETAGASRLTRQTNGHNLRTLDVALSEPAARERSAPARAIREHRRFCHRKTMSSPQVVYESEVEQLVNVNAVSPAGPHLVRSSSSEILNRLGEMSQRRPIRDDKDKPALLRTRPGRSRNSENSDDEVSSIARRNDGDSAKSKRPRTYSVSVREHNYLIEEIQSLAEQIQEDLQEGKKTPSPSPSPHRRGATDCEEKSAIEELREENERLRSALEKQGEQIRQLREENGKLIFVETRVWKLVENWLSDCRDAVESRANSSASAAVSNANADRHRDVSDVSSV
ncbi:serine/threonine-protein kinase Nek9-like isoform X2 [Oscarella lobularis]|uniref:serine/threonine-protein kinase Nek9-like isoform X2 n=1 Tax=Oscarella lobularis TaxID=121494 RepID=UPI0033136327